MGRNLHVTFAIATAVVCLAAVPPASAVEPFAAPVRVSPDGCVRASAAAGPDGVVRGGVQCGWQLRPIVGDGRRWRVGPALTPQGELLDAAQDKTGTYLLYRGTRGGIGLVKLARDGKPGPTRVVTPSTGVSSFGSIVARDGRWAAVWSQSTTDAPKGDLWQAGTLFAQQERRRITTDPRSDTGPTLALRPGGGLAMLWARHDNNRTQIRLATSTGGGWSARDLAASPSITYPSLVAGPRSLFATWTRGTRAVIASNESGPWVSRSPTAWPCARDNVRVAPVRTRLVLGYNTCDNSRLAVHERAASAWTGATLFRTPAPELNELTAAPGRAVVIGARLGNDPSRFHIVSRSQT